jgi:hypothetical protein
LTGASTGKSLFKACFRGIFLYSFQVFLGLNLFLNSSYAKPVFIDRTVAVVGEDPITYREVELMYITGMILDGFRVRLYDVSLSPEDFGKARYSLIKTRLVTSHLERIALKNPVKDE